MSTLKFRIHSRPATPVRVDLVEAEKRAEEMNKQALAILAAARDEQAAQAGKLFKVAGSGETKHERLLREAIARKNARELAEKVRVIPAGRVRDKKDLLEGDKSGGKSVRDTSRVGELKIFGTQGRWD